MKMTVTGKKKRQFFVLVFLNSSCQCFKEWFPVDRFPDEDICSHEIIKILYLQTSFACVDLVTHVSQFISTTWKVQKKGKERNKRFLK